MPVPAFAALWQPPPPSAAPRRRPAFFTTTREVGPAETFVAGVQRETCPACGWQWGTRPTRCRCIGAMPRVAREQRVEPHWTERVDP